MIILPFGFQSRLYSSTCKTSIHVNSQQMEESENEIDDEATDNDSTSLI
jgi:hypothetical protein